METKKFDYTKRIPVFKNFDYTKMFLVITKIEHPITRKDYRYSDGRRVFFGEDSVILDGDKRPWAKTKTEIEALYDCGMYGIEIVRRHSVRFELRSRFRKGKVVKSWYDGSWTIKGEHITGDDAEAVSVRAEFWRWLESAIGKQSQSTIERIRKQAAELIPLPQVGL